MNKDVTGFFVTYDVAKFVITGDEDNSEKSGLGVFENWWEKGLLQYGNDKKITDWEKSVISELRVKEWLESNDTNHCFILRMQVRNAFLLA